MRTMLVATNEPREREDEPFGAANLITVFLPLFVLLLPAVFFFRHLNVHLKKNRVVIERNMDHMARMEEKTDRVIALLESIRDERSKR